MSKRFHLALLAALVAIGASGCGGDELIGTVVPNTPPDTQVEATPPNLQATSFNIDFFWSGADPDGSIAYYEWVITDNGENNVFSPDDTTGVDKWTKTFVSDSTFVVSADIPDFPDDANSDQINNIENVRFWQTHTFLIRAVDDRGIADPTPASVSFTATTITPRVRVVAPNFPLRNQSCSLGPLALSFEWEATDPDNPDGGPAEIRYVLREWAGPTAACLTDQRYRTENPIGSLSEDQWGPWIPYDAGDDSGTVKRYPILEQPEGTSFLFAVQARDVAGAVTPVFEFGENVIHVKTTSQKFPVLTVTEQNLGSTDVVGRGRIVRFDIVAGQPIRFEWLANADDYGGVVDEYRYGFEVEDPENEEDSNWAVPWGPSWRSAARPTGFALGSPNFVVQARDNSGAISRLVYQFQVVQVKARKDQRPLLLVDDSDEKGNLGIEALWDSQWENNLLGVQDFSPASDVADIKDIGSRLEFARVNDYRAVVWLVSSDSETFIAQNFAPLNNGDSRFNWLDIYQKFVGNVMLVGPQAMMNSIERPRLIKPVVFNLSDSPPRGLGTEENAQGQEINRGTLRYPYTAWCLESVDFVQASDAGAIDANGVRTKGCDSYTYARVSQDYVERYRPSTSRVGNLYPLSVRVNVGEPGTPPDELRLFGEFSIPFEEFYNVNAPNRAGIVLSLRDCQVPMYEAIARMDVDNVDIMQPLDLDPDYQIPTRDRLVPTTTNPDTGALEENCPAVQRDSRRTSTVTGAPIVISSTQYIDTKQNGSVPFEDYLWGFNPLSFERAEVKAAVEWILLNQWGLNDQ